jgi:hypothetical protein
VTANKANNEKKQKESIVWRGRSGAYGGFSWNAVRVQVQFSLGRYYPAWSTIPAAPYIVSLASTEGPGITFVTAFG